MRRLDQHVARIGQRQQAAATQAGDEIGSHMNVRTGDQAKGNFLFVENHLQVVNSQADGGAGVMIQSREDVRCAGHDRYALRDRRPRHIERHGQVAGPVVDPGQYVAMKIDQRISPGSKMCAARG